MPRKGRQVELRHIFPWVAAPYIEFLRVLLRIERFVLSPFMYLQAWTVSAFFGILGIILSVALFIPKLTASQTMASPTRLISRDMMPSIYVPEEDLALPESRYTPGESDLRVIIERTEIPGFNPEEIVRTESKPLIRSIRNVITRDNWLRHQDDPEEIVASTHQPYTQQAAVYNTDLSPLIPEYQFDPGIGDFQSHRLVSSSVEIQKSVARGVPDEPMTYVVSVRNVGRDIISSTNVEERVSDMRCVVDTDPPAMVHPIRGTLVWELNELQPDEVRHLRITLIPDRRHAAFTETTTANFSTAPLIAETMIREKPVVQPPEPAPVEEPPPVREPVAQPVRESIPGAPRLVLEFDPPSKVRVGEELHAYYTITNVGTADATDIRLYVEVPAELKHRYGSLVEHKISRLAPNESRKALFAALAERAGQMSLNWTLECHELDNQTSSELLAVNPPITPSGTPRSTIPDTRPAEPTPIEPEIPSTTDPLSTWKQPRPTYDTPRSINPRGGSPYGPQPAPGSSIPSTIPSWIDPTAVTPPATEDWNSRTPISPDVAPDERIPLGTVDPPTDLPSLEQDPLPDSGLSNESIPSNSSIPPRSSIPNGPVEVDPLPGVTIPPETLPIPDADPQDSPTAPDFPADPPEQPELPPVEGKPL